MSEEINIVGHFNVAGEFGGYLSQHRDSKADRSEPLMTEAQHKRIVSKLTDAAEALELLRAENAELVAALVEVTASLEWNAHGRCRGINDGPIMPSAMAVEVAQQALAKHRGE